MLGKEVPVHNPTIDNAVLELDSSFRLNFKDLIKESKLYAHKCQYLCYEKRNDLLEAESCARNCFKPILHSKKNISVLIENLKENFEKCRFTAQTVNKDETGAKKGIVKCLKKYQSDLDGLKEEVEYIYKGYMKNFDSLIAEAEKKEKNDIVKDNFQNNKL